MIAFLYRRRMGLARAALVALLIIYFSAPSFAQSQNDYFPTGEWRATKAKKQGLSKGILKSLIKRIRANEIRDLNSLLIVRNGYLVVEEYFNGSNAEDVHTLQSDSKSITSLLVGIALGRCRRAMR